jgi:hypothetical protein
MQLNIYAGLVLYSAYTRANCTLQEVQANVGLWLVLKFVLFIPETLFGNLKYIWR